MTVIVVIELPEIIANASMILFCLPSTVAFVQQWSNATAQNLLGMA